MEKAGRVLNRHWLMAKTKSREACRKDTAVKCSFLMQEAAGCGGTHLQSQHLGGRGTRVTRSLRPAWVT